MDSSRRFLAATILLALITSAAAQQPADRVPTDSTRPNILWIYVEDTNDWMSCYGDELIETPNIDALAASGTRFTRAYMPAGVCSPTRSAIITGMHQTTIGAHQHYSSFEKWRGITMDEWDPNYLGVRTIPRSCGWRATTRSTRASCTTTSSTTSTSSTTARSAR